MRIPFARLSAPVGIVALLAGCSAAASSGGAGSTAPVPNDPALYDEAAAAQVTPDARGLPYTEADVHFMAGMIPHHAQAVVMSRWAPERALREDLKTLAARILVSQTDEIRMMQGWLRDRDQAVPDADATRHVMTMGGMEHEMMMPGMLTDEQLAQLEAARGAEFDRLFLDFMIPHHEGAMIMVEDLFEEYGAAQDEAVFRFASDVWADQGAEIERMQIMLEQQP